MLSVSGLPVLLLTIFVPNIVNMNNLIHSNETLHQIRLVLLLLYVVRGSKIALNFNQSQQKSVIKHPKSGIS